MHVNNVVLLSSFARRQVHQNAEHLLRCASRKRCFATGFTSDVKSSPFQHLAVGQSRPEITHFKDSVRQQKLVKEQLAGVFRVLARRGHDEGIAGHCSVRDPVDKNTFWVNPWTKAFSQMKASDLVQVNTDGTVNGMKCVDGSACGIHAPLYRTRPDIQSLVHAHGPFTKAFSALGKHLPINNQDSCVFHDCHVLVSFGGVVESQDEGERIAKALRPDTKIALLENHGTLSIGKIGPWDAAWWFIQFEICAQVQMLLEPCSAKEVGSVERDYTKREVGTPEMGYLGFAPYYEEIDTLTSGAFRT